MFPLGNVVDGAIEVEAQAVAPKFWCAIALDAVAGDISCCF